MDDVAKKAGVSKKTIYQCYTDKSELVNNIVDDMASEQALLFKTCESSARDAVEEVLMKSSATLQTWVPVRTNFFVEMEKSFPGAWKKLVKHKQQVVLPGIISNLEKGIREGLYRSDLAVAFTANMCLHQQESVLQTNSFTIPGRSAGQLLQDLTQFFLHGICTQKGKSKLDKYIINSNENR